MLESYERMLRNAKKTEEIRQRLAQRILTETRMKLNLMDLKEKMKGV